MKEYLYSKFSIIYIISNNNLEKCDIRYLQNEWIFKNEKC